MDLVSASFVSPDGVEFTRDVVRHPGAVAVVPLHEDGTVTLVRQFRAPLGHDLLEIPAGLRDVADEDPLDTARRELAEEVGLAADRIERLNAFHNAPGHCDEQIVVYVATGLSSVPDDLQGVEENHMTIERHALGDLVAMIRRGEVTDAKTIIAVLLLAGR